MSQIYRVHFDRENLKSRENVRVVRHPERTYPHVNCRFRHPMTSIPVHLEQTKLSQAWGLIHDIQEMIERDLEPKDMTREELSERPQEFQKRKSLNVKEARDLSSQLRGVVPPPLNAFIGAGMRFGALDLYLKERSKATPVAGLDLPGSLIAVGNVPELAELSGINPDANSADKDVYEVEVVDLVTEYLVSGRAPKTESCPECDHRWVEIVEGELEITQECPDLFYIPGSWFLHGSQKARTLLEPYGVGFEAYGRCP